MIDYFPILEGDIQLNLDKEMQTRLADREFSFSDTLLKVVMLNIPQFLKEESHLNLEKNMQTGRIESVNSRMINHREDLK